ncbi:hypothetical protein UQW22_05895 [Isoptericola halotolerans]|uniref:hypothetical protein n=1 Tax=Isoptericola halotolerans TaxID=300560 RepID=UPI00388E5D24
MTTTETHGEHLRTVHSSAHEHGWLVESSHPVSSGRILYVRCAECGARRVDQQDHRRRPPVALSRELRATPDGPGTSPRREPGC